MLDLQILQRDNLNFSVFAELRLMDICQSVKDSYDPFVKKHLKSHT